MSNEEASEPGLLSKLVGKKNKSSEKNDDAKETASGEEEHESPDGESADEAVAAAPETPPQEDGQVDELRHRIGELETTLESASTSLEGLRGEQQMVSESLDALNETNRRLLGIYDQVVADANPFRDEEATARFGVFGSSPEPAVDDHEVEQAAGVAHDGDTAAEPEPAAESEPEPVASADADADAGSQTDAPVDADSEQVDETVSPSHARDNSPEAEVASEPSFDVDEGDPAPKRSFADLLAETEAAEEAAELDETEVVDQTDAVDATESVEETEAVEAPEPVEEVTAPVDSDSDADEAAEVASAEEESDADAEPVESAESSAETEATDDSMFGVTHTSVDDGLAPLALGAVGAPQVGYGDDPVLPALPVGIIADVLTMEWLGHLVSVGGVARTLQALAFYERIGWLGRDARRDLERYLAGADDSAVGDRQFETVDHDQSYQHIARLALIDRIEPVLGGY